MLARRADGVTPLSSPAVLDLNAHVLPGIHGGTPDLPAAVAAVRTLLAAGVTAAVAPAVVGGNVAHDIAAADAARRDLTDALAAADLPLVLLPGAVVPAERLPDLPPEVLSTCTAGGGGRWIVVTLPSPGWPLSLATTVDRLALSGLGVVIAHPERAESAQMHADRLRDLIGRGALVQVAAGSLAGLHGARAEHTAFDLLRNGMVTVVASDEPSDTRSALDLGAAAATLERVLRRPREEVAWMLATGPGQIVAGERVRPPRLVPMPRDPA